MTLPALTMMPNRNWARLTDEQTLLLALTYLRGGSVWDYPTDLSVSILAEMLRCAAADHFHAQHDYLRRINFVHFD